MKIFDVRFLYKMAAIASVEHVCIEKSVCVYVDLSQVRKNDPRSKYEMEN